MIGRNDPNSNWGNPNSNGSVYPNNPWPATSNPYLPSSNGGISMGTANENTTVMTAEDLKKLAKVKKYRSIDDPWEGA
jgi:hypothetical protein